MSADAPELAIAGELTIYTALQRKAELLDGLRARPHGRFALDLSEVTEIDTAGLQLLVLARSVAAACGRELRLVRPSSAVREVLALCQFGAGLIDGDDRGAA